MDEVVGGLPTVVGLIGGIFGLLACVAAGLVYLKMGMAKTTIDLYRQDNEALRGRVDTIENERDDLKSQVQMCNGKISALEEERQVLRDLATGHTAVKQLAIVVDERFAEIKSLLLKLTDDRREH